MVAGVSDQARTRMHEALHLAQELGHPFSLALALNFAAWLASRARGRAHRPGACGRDGGAVQRARVSLLRGMGQLSMRGGALIAQEQWEEGIAQIQQGLEAYAGEVRRTVSSRLAGRGVWRSGTGRGRAWRRLPRRCGWWRRMTSASTRRRCIGLRGTPAGAGRLKATG